MILQDLGIKYEILEASDRIGGRIYTYRFNGDEGVRAPVNTPARYDYFDIGAMRYPNIPFMNRVFDLFTRVGIDDLLIDYHLSSDNALKYFNSRPPVTATQVEGEPDYFHVSVANGGTVPDDYLSEGVDRWTEKVYDPFKVLFAGLDGAETVEERQEIFKKAWDKLASQDYLSTRAYMLSPHGLQTATEDKESQLPFNPPSYPESVVEWLESFDTATGLYNQAFVESVLDSLDFGWPHPQFALPPRSQDESEDVGWKCIDGGSDRFIHGMLKKLETQPELNQRVTKIARVGSIMEVTTPSGTRQYSQVISTVPLGCLSAIDTEGCDLLYSQKQAIRALHYDASTKVAVKFAARWWEDPTVMDTGVIKGGQSSTDLPIRTCVYPSYGLSCPEAPGVLLASYTWAQDARRLGGLCQPQDTPSGEQLLELTLDNLEKLHGLPRSRFGPVLGFHAHSWETDPYARGAFALFGPTQFGRPGDSQSLFASMKAPAAGGLFHIAGEATSVHHAWVLGSLNSAWRAVYNALIGRPEERKKLIENWDIPDEETEVHLQQLALLARHRAL
ncbi:amine oxidase [Obba rivulosa]|uniref:Amine oxidase n=1 Tax=Obba rivulosa TaxID=1052685 RepID=A0A8E2ATE5_9APHY|nr:amine oxidase [Obba rivulosa]